jgi:SPP1 family predicted phage head-tail adaptor
MRAGLLNTTITIEQQINNKGEFGATNISWVPYKSTKARCTYSSGNRTNENNEIFFAYEVIFTIRIYHKVSENMRIIWEGRKYRILAIEKQKAQQQIVIKTELINE